MVSLWRVFDRTLSLSVVAVYALLTVLTFAQVLVRYVLGGSLTWSEEAVRFLFIWLAFVGAAITMQREGHVGVRFLVDLFPVRAQRVANLLSDGCILAFLLFFTVKGLEISQATMSNLSPAMQIPMGYVYLVLPVSGLLLTINTVRLATLHWRGQPAGGGLEI